MKNTVTCLGMGLWCLLVSTAAQAQGTFKPGYVVKAAGDTVRGFIQPRGAARNAVVCRFRPAPNAPAVNYAPDGLRGYGLTNGLRYETRLVPLPDSAGLQPKRLFFLELLESGKATLYTRRDNYDETRFYLYMAPATEVIELEQRLHKAKNATEVDRIEPVYRKTLSTAFRDCFAVQPELDKLGFSVSSLTGIFRRYNSYYRTSTAAPQPNSRGPRAGIAFGIVAGAARTNMQVKGDNSLHNGTFTTNATPMAGLFVAAPLPFLNEKLELRLDALYEQLTYSSTYVARDVATVELREQASLQFRCVRLPLQLRYHFLRGRVQPFLLAGVSGSYLLSNERHLRSEYTAGGSPVVTNKQPFPNDGIRSFDMGLLAGAGVAITALQGHAIGIELRAEPSSGYVSVPNSPAPLMQYEGLISISLF